MENLSRKIFLVKMQPEHFSLFFCWWNNLALRRLTSGELNKLSNQQIIKSLKKFLANKKRHDFIIYLESQPIGHLAVQKKPRRRFYEVYIAIGEKKFWGKGIGTITMKKVCQWFAKYYPKQRILSLEVLPKNLRAIRCYQKVGFKIIGHVRCQKFPETILMHKFFKH